MSNKKIQKENFDIEINKEHIKSGQTTNQLQNWCRLFECLSKQPKATESSVTRNKQSGISFAGSMIVKSSNILKKVGFRRELRNKRTYFNY